MCPDLEIKRKLDNFKNFGITSEVDVEEVGINGKMSEMHAAFGLTQLSCVDQMVDARRMIDASYRAALADVPGIALLSPVEGASTNGGYFPIMVTDDYSLSRDGLYEALKTQGVFSRRYFYPLISEMPTYRDFPSATHDNLPMSHYVADRVLCLPIYPDLDSADLTRVVDLIVKWS